MHARTLVKDQQSEQLFYKWTVSRHEDVAPKVRPSHGLALGEYFIFEESRMLSLAREYPA